MPPGWAGTDQVGVIDGRLAFPEGTNSVRFKHEMRGDFSMALSFSHPYYSSVSLTLIASDGRAVVPIKILSPYGGNEKIVRVFDQMKQHASQNLTNQWNLIIERTEGTYVVTTSAQGNNLDFVQKYRTAPDISEVRITASVKWGTFIITSVRIGIPDSR